MKRIKGGAGNIILTQGDKHDRLRRFHSRLLSPKAVALKFLIRRIERKGSADLAADYADQLPPRVIAALFGMPWQDDDLVKRILHLHEDVMAWIGMQHVEGPLADRAVAAGDELNAMLLHYLRLRRDQPADDFASRIWLDAPEYYGDIDEAAALGISREIFLGGSDTTVHALANCFYLMLTRPDLRAQIETDRRIVGRVREGVDARLRLGPVSLPYRGERHEIGAVNVNAGGTLVLVHAAANRDPKKFACPMDIDLNRPRLRDHLAFNVGPRTCVGAGLARAEMHDSIQKLLDRLPDLRPDPGAEPPRFSSLFMRSWRPLHGRFNRPERASAESPRPPR